MFTSIRNRILFTVVVILVLSLSLNTTINYYISSNSISKSINATLVSLTESNTATIEQWINSRTAQISSISSVVTHADPAPVLKQAADSGNFLNVDMTFPDKKVISSDPSGIPADYDPTSRPWYIDASKVRHVIITAPYQDIASHRLTITIAAATFINEELKAVIEGDISMDEITRRVRAIHPTQHSFCMLIDNQGNIIAHPNDALTLTSLDKISPKLNISHLLTSKTPVEATVSGLDTYLLARPVEGTSWYMVVAINKNDEQSGMDDLLKMSAISLLILICLSVLIMGYITRKSFSSLITIRKTMDEFFSSEKGDLTQRLPVQGKDEVAQIAIAFNGFTDKLVEVMTSIRTNSDQVRSVAMAILSGNDDLASRTEASAASLQQTSASLEQISANVAHSSATASSANIAVINAANGAQQGKEAVVHLTETMKEIEAASTQISVINSVINGIAFQTNILALNASVEAARAGEQGRGFAVVANEVRQLASRSAEAAKEIGRLIETTVSSVASGVQQVENTSSRMQNIVDCVSTVSTMIAEISQATDEQTKGISEINKAVYQLESMVQSNVSLTDESKSTSAQLMQQANELMDAIQRYKM